MVFLKYSDRSDLSRQVRVLSMDFTRKKKKQENSTICKDEVKLYPQSTRQSPLSPDRTHPVDLSRSLAGFRHRRSLHSQLRLSLLHILWFSYLPVSAFQFCLSSSSPFGFAANLGRWVLLCYDCPLGSPVPSAWVSSFTFFSSFRVGARRWIVEVAAAVAMPQRCRWSRASAMVNGVRNSEWWWGWVVASPSRDANANRLYLLPTPFCLALGFRNLALIGMLIRGLVCLSMVACITQKIRRCQYATGRFMVWWARQFFKMFPFAYICHFCCWLCTIEQGNAYQFFLYPTYFFS